MLESIQECEFGRGLSRRFRDAMIQAAGQSAPPVHQPALRHASKSALSSYKGHLKPSKALSMRDRESKKAFCIGPQDVQLKQLACSFASKPGLSLRPSARLCTPPFLLNGPAGSDNVDLQLAGLATEFVSACFSVLMPAADEDSCICIALSHIGSAMRSARGFFQGLKGCKGL
ncbi:unnamed protein product [Symbiodinium natans]|uniref:Uncharacterized protein n=1 Tax=Symbiodinium natans TaxID=878477 RepID=A0A812PMA7_9DINO|nr:unnamed protein product [Symbiodinium natans]